MLKDLPLALRPREKLLALGPQSLADAELIALLLRTGVRGRSVLQLAQQLLDHFRGLPGLLQAQPEELRSIKGLGPAKRAELQAVLELARRSLNHEVAAQPVFATSAEVRDHLRLHLGHLPHEVFAVMFLDVHNRLLRLEPMFRGTLTHASVYPREVVRRALELNAGSVILAHNHPSGVGEPSRADEHLTTALRQALALVDVRVIDHLVVTRSGVVSFVDRGLL